MPDQCAGCLPLWPPSAMAAFRYRCLPPYTKLDEGHAERSTLHKIQFGPRFFHLNWLFALHTGAKHQDRVSKHLPWSQKYVALSEFCATIKGQRSPNRIMCTRDRKKGGADLSLPLLESLLAVRRPTARAAATYSAFSSAMSFAFESTPRLETLSSYTFLPVGCCSSHSFSARSSQLLA